MSDYFFSETNKDQLVKGLAEKVTQFQQYAINTGLAQGWQKNKDAYENRFYSDFDGLDIFNMGEQGEILAMSLGHYRNIIRHALNPIISTPISFTVCSANAQVESRRAADIKKKLITYYDQVKGYKGVLDDATEYGMVYGSGFYVSEWNPDLGRVIGEEREGDFDDEAISVFDMFYDFTRRRNHDWYIFRRKRNKYDLAAAFTGDKKRMIENIDPFYVEDMYYDSVNDSEMFSTDDIFVYSCYHKVTPAMPKGRFVMYCGNGDTPIHLYDNDSIYGEDLPVFPMNPSKYLENGFGYTDANLLRAPQYVLNDAISSMLTNAQSGTKDVWCPSGDEVDAEVVSSGRTLWQSKVKPEVIDLMGDNSGLIEIANFMKNAMETLSGQNAVVRGDVTSTPQLKSGIALQTVVAMGQQYSHGLAEARNKTFEAVTDFRVRVLGKLMRSKKNVERVVDIVGKNNISEVMAFTADDLEGAGKVVINQVNPILNTPAGRIELAEQFMQMNPQAFTWDDYMEVVNTGNLQNALESNSATPDYIAQVKEWLLEGTPVEPIMGTNHPEVIKEVHSLLLNLTFTQDENNQEAVVNITDFITKSMELMRNGDEISNLIYGGQPPMPAPPDLPEEAMEEIISQEGQEGIPPQMPPQGLPEPGEF